ncbi:hypothetical protein [Anaeromyxobacter terrae]|uniref:hypothetical protein n=1 Tax=Anaeromyxobacter terrae TaxID=2925406 RepID=UPI001F5ABEE0|nr:hypothetical protein [Anaeromyxobacter sp. SG22]
MKQRDAAKATSLILLAAVALSVLVLQRFRVHLDAYFAADQRFAVLQNVLVAVGSALIGAAAIAFALIVFAVQVNIERMPHAMFRRLSSDRGLLGSFLGAFSLAIGIASAALLFDRRWLTVMTLGAGWATLLIPALLLYAYNRALRLVAPTHHLQFVVADATRSLSDWARRASRAAPLFETPEAERPPLRMKHDHAATTFFRLNAHWTARALDDLRYAVSFARRYVERRDHSAARDALTAAVAINAAYIRAKGKTFYPVVPFFDHPLAVDGFINETLEQLRQEISAATARQDEPAVEIMMRCMSDLARLYTNIDYGTEGASRYHSVLAAGYLSGALETTIQREFTDVAMEGVRLLGATGQALLSRGNSADADHIISKIASTAGASFGRESTRPVVRTCVEELSKLAVTVLVSRSPDPRHIAAAVTQAVYRVALIVLTLPAHPLSDPHGQHLDPYFSASSATALPKQLTDLGNQLIEAKPDNISARDVIQNVLVWAEGLEDAHRDLLIAAVKSRSIFALSLVQSSNQIARVLFALTRAPAARTEAKSALEQAALGLIAGWSWVPADRETVGFVESFRVADHLFEVAMEAHLRGCSDAALRALDVLLGWGFQASQHNIGLGSFESSLMATVAFTLATNGDMKRQLANIVVRLGKADAPAQDMRRRAAREISERAASARRRGYSLSAIDQVLMELDPAAVHAAVDALAKVLTGAAP